MLPKGLKKGDTIAIIAPAKQIERDYVDFAVKTIEKLGFKAVVSAHCLGQNNYFSGTVAERQSDLQWALDNEEVKAILCARGGYGCIHIVDKVDWSKFDQNPKWIIGFSDVTIFHQYLANKGVSSLHATMPLNFQENSSEALASLFQALQTGELSYEWNSETRNIPGTVQGELIGGNLSVFTSLIGTNLMPSYQDKILFMEDVGEALYAIDRSFQQLSKSGVLAAISGLIVGDFSSMRDSNPPYGEDLQSIIKSYFTDSAIPVAFNFPAGHCDDNRGLIMGKEVTLTVLEEKVMLVGENNVL